VFCWSFVNNIIHCWDGSHQPEAAEYLAPYQSFPLALSSLLPFASCDQLQGQVFGTGAGLPSHMMKNAYVSLATGIITLKTFKVASITAWNGKCIVRCHTMYVLHSRTWRKINKQSLDTMTCFGKFWAKHFSQFFYEFTNSTIFI
jgi:hypothetical protein